MRVRIIPKTFAHLLAISSEHETGDDQILPRRSAEKMCRENEQRVEPTPSLIDTLRHEVAREVLEERFLIFEWVM